MLVESFLLGLATPLTALCVLPLYPGFVAYVANADDGLRVWQVGCLVGVGVVLSFLVVGFVVSAVLSSSLSSFIGVAAPVVYAALFVLGFRLAVFDAGIPVSVPSPSGSSWLTPLLYGGVFGVAALPCNPAFIAYFFAELLRSSALSAARSVLEVAVFGAGMAAPLVVLAVVSEAAASTVISALKRWKRGVNVVSGSLLMGVSAYYLFVDFAVQSWLF